MELIKLAKLAPEVTSETVRNVLKQSKRIPGLTLFNDVLPTAVLFSPNADFKGSLHFMFMPPNTAQEFHYHPGARYLIILGDIDVYMFYNTCGIETNPEEGALNIKIPKGWVCLVRFKANFWHKFLTKRSKGTGMYAFTFHEDDQIESDTTHTKKLMEEKTYYWGK